MALAQQYADGDTTCKRNELSTLLNPLSRIVVSMAAAIIGRTRHRSCAKSHARSFLYNFPDA